MYNPKPWEDKQEHAGYGNLFSRGKDLKYHQEEKYGSSEKNVGSDYMKAEAQKEEDKDKKESIFDEADEQKKEEELKEEDIQFKAANQVFRESKLERKKEPKKKEISSIDEAIKKAVEEEKKIIMMDN